MPEPISGIHDQCPVSLGPAPPNLAECVSIGTIGAPSQAAELPGRIPLEDDLADWIGRAESRPGELTPLLAGMLGAALGHDASGAMPHEAGAPLPPLWHWAAFPAFVPHADIGRDGHPKLGGFLPPVPLERRMWAGGRVTFSGTLHVGESLERRSEILAVEEKSGGAGQMVFVTVGHHIEGERGGEIVEEQDIVYIAMPESYRPPKRVPAPDNPTFEERVDVNEVRLFRYSAATFNAHRIHYDLAYTREIEKYPALVVHGPLQATLLMEAAVRHAGRTPARLRYRGVHPMFCDHELRLLGVAEDNSMALCTATDAGYQGLQAKVEWD